MTDHELVMAFLANLYLHNRAITQRLQVMSEARHAEFVDDFGGKSSAAETRASGSLFTGA
jgi:hypothetical protein